jgi:hypothetical protein
MWFEAYVTDWKDGRDSSYRVAPSNRGAYVSFVLNPNRISDLEEGDDHSLQVPTSKFKYFDNPLNPREKYGYVKTKTAIAVITAAADDAFHSYFITLPMFRNNNPDNATEDKTIPCAYLAYALAYSADASVSWVVYYNGAFKRREVLVDLSLAELLLLADTGSKE